MVKKRFDWKVLVVSLLVVYGVAFVGSLFTSSNVDTEWYESVRPAITPPNWVFPVVWNVLFFLIGLSLYFVWIGADKINGANKINKLKKSDRKLDVRRVGRLGFDINKIKLKIIVVFGVNFVLNVLWSVLYFGMRNPLFAFFDLVFLWMSIIVMIVVCYRIDRKAGYLLVPYLLWVSFAGVLNWLSV